MLKVTPRRPLWIATLCLAPLWAATPARPMPSPEAVPAPGAIACALKRMLTYADAPAVLGIDPGWEFTVKADKSLSQGLCSRDGVEIGGPPAALLFQVELGETDANPDPVSTEQKVWQYPSPAQAQRDWRVLLRRSRHCRGEQREPDGAGGWLMRHLTHGRTATAVDGEAGFWVWSRVELDGPAAADTPDGGFYVFHLVGDSIHSVEYDYPDAGGLSAAKRSAVATLAWRLARRWLRGGRGCR